MEGGRPGRGRGRAKPVAHAAAVFLTQRAKPLAHAAAVFPIGSTAAGKLTQPPKIFLPPPPAAGGEKEGGRGGKGKAKKKKKKGIARPSEST